MNHCKQCNIGFEITNSHQEFYNRIDVPAPTLCPDCRQQRRLSFRNERNLYRISCDCCKRTIISIYSPDKKLTVYCNDCWWSDKWDPHSYGKDFDFSRTFFEQFNDLKANIPNFALLNINSENSEYTHLETDDKNCYMNFGGHYNEDCYYNLHALKCQDCVDNYWVDQCRGCYECFKCFSSHNLKFCFWCHNSHDLTFCYDCKGCSDCFGCTSLRQKQYYFFNKPMTKEGYNKKMNAWVSNTANIDLAKYESEILWKSTPRLNLFIEKSQNSTGNFLKNCKNCTNCYETDEAEDCTYCDLVLGLKDCMDCTRMGYRTELCYEVMGATISNNVAFLNFSFNVISDSRYIDCCSSIHNCFGCTNLHHKKYCILNKQYTKGEYDKLVLKII